MKNSPISNFKETEKSSVIGPRFHVTEELEPIVYGVRDSKQKLVVLLQLAAEIEHVLLIQYLYTLFTIENSKYFEPIKRIAIQEMGHLMSVQNILIAIEGISGVHLHKDLLRPNSQKKPMPFALEPLTKDVLAKYTAIEMPVSLISDTKFKPLVDHVADKIRMIPNPVGIIYTKILNLMGDESISYSNSGNIQSEREYWGSTAMEIYSVILKSVMNRKVAIDLATEIAEQGEGPDEKNQSDSHFHTFFELYENFRPEDATKRKIAINPVLTDNPEFEISTTIKNEYSVLWIDLFNQVYCTLLYDIYGSLLTKAINPVKYAKKFSSFALENMKKSHAQIGAIILELPVEISLVDTLELNSDSCCGPTYEIPKDFAPEYKVNLFIAQVESKSEDIRKIIANIRTHKYFAEHSNQRTIITPALENVLNDIQVRINLINKLKNEQTKDLS